MRACTPMYIYSFENLKNCFVLRVLLRRTECSAPFPQSSPWLLRSIFYYPFKPDRKTCLLLVRVHVLLFSYQAQPKIILLSDRPRWRWKEAYYFLRRENITTQFHCGMHHQLGIRVGLKYTCSCTIKKSGGILNARARGYTLPYFMRWKWIYTDPNKILVKRKGLPLIKDDTEAPFDCNLITWNIQCHSYFSFFGVLQGTTQPFPDAHLLNIIFGLSSNIAVADRKHSLARIMVFRGNMLPHRILNSVNIYLCVTCNLNSLWRKWRKGCARKNKKSPKTGKEKKGREEHILWTTMTSSAQFFRLLHLLSSLFLTLHATLNSLIKVDEGLFSQMGNSVLVCGGYRRKKQYTCQ